MSPKLRRLEGEHLPALAERRLDFAQGSAAARGDHKLGGLVADDAAVSADVKRPGLGRAAEECLAAAADDRQRRVVGDRASDLIGEGGARVGVHSGLRSMPPRPTSGRAAQTLVPDHGSTGRSMPRRRAGTGSIGGER